MRSSYSVLIKQTNKTDPDCGPNTKVLLEMWSKMRTEPKAQIHNMKIHQMVFQNPRTLWNHCSPQLKRPRPEPNCDPKDRSLRPWSKNLRSESNLGPKKQAQNKMWPKRQRFEPDCAAKRQRPEQDYCPKKLRLLYYTIVQKSEAWTKPWPRRQAWPKCGPEGRAQNQTVTLIQ